MLDLFFIAKIICVILSVLFSLIAWVLIILCLIYLSPSKRNTLYTQIDEFHKNMLKKKDNTNWKVYLKKQAKNILLKPETIINILLLVIPFIPFKINTRVAKSITNNILVEGLFKMYGSPKLLKNLSV